MSNYIFMIFLLKLIAIYYNKLLKLCFFFSSFFPCLLKFFKKIFYLFIFGERGKEGEREGEKYREGERVGCLSHAPNWGPGLQPRQGIKLMTFQFSGWRSTHWATSARALSLSLLSSFFSFLLYTENSQVLNSKNFNLYFS